MFILRAGFPPGVCCVELRPALVFLIRTYSRFNILGTNCLVTLHVQQLLYIESIHQVSLWCEKVLSSFHSGFGSPGTLYVCPGSVGGKKILFALALVTPFK